MELLFPAPMLLLWIILAVYIIAGLGLLFKKNKLIIKIIAFVFITVVCGLILFFFYRDSRLVIDEQGTKFDDFFGGFYLSWEEVESAAFIDNLNQSEYKPVLKTWGFSFGDIAFGWFSLKNGKSAQVVLQTRKKCLVINTIEKTYLFAPIDFDEFIGSVIDYIKVENYSGEKYID